jgi:hypothetical protein
MDINISRRNYVGTFKHKETVYVILGMFIISDHTVVVLHSGYDLEPQIKFEP